MQRTLETMRLQSRSISRRLFSTTSPSLSSTRSTPTPPPPTSSPSHYLITLLRSPLHLNPSIKQSLSSLGLYKRLSSSIVPISPQNEGYILRAKELVGVRTLREEEVRELGSMEWRDREGEGRKGSGLRVRQGAGQDGVIRVGSERARGEERGFKVVQ